MPELELYVPLSAYLPAEFWLADLLTPEDGSFLDKIAYDQGLILYGEDSFTARVALRVMTETAFWLPAGFALVMGSGALRAYLHVHSNGFFAQLELELLKLRLPRSLFIPVIETDGELKPDPDLSHFVDITLPVGLTLNQDFNIELQWPGETEGTLSLPPCMLGESGVIISAENIVLRLSNRQPLPAGAATAGLPADWRGLFIQAAAIHLPEGLASAVPEALTFTNCYIGAGGFSGQVAAQWSPALSGTLFGTTFGLTRFELNFIQSTLAGSGIHGALMLPFFDETLGVEIGLNFDGSLAVRLLDDDGLLTLTKPGILSLTVDSLGFEVQAGLFTAKLSGQIRPLLGGLDWPAFEVRELAIDAEGNVRLDGGWLDLPQQYSFDFYSFQMEISKLGFGKTDDAGKWLGFSGGLKLVDGMTAGASVEGLRVVWYDDGREPRISFEGVGVEFEVPEVLRFKGTVAYHELALDGQTIHRFDGDIKLELLALDVQVDGTLVIGSTGAPAGASTFLAIYLNAELPASIPLWATGLALYGLAGLFALNMEPDKQADESWYENPDGSPGWYKRPAIGVTDLAQKWAPRAGALALGAGITLGTVADNGYAFSGRLLLAIVFPGPVLLLEGRANILQERAKLSQEPTFRALAVLDKRADTFLVGLDAQYKFADQGQLIDIRGGAEAFFNFDDASAWHLYVGEREPVEKRIQANIFQFFEASAYFMLDANQIAMGARRGYDRDWTFGPLKVSLESWLEGNAIVSWKPSHFYGDLWQHGQAKLTAFGFGVSLGVDARLAADVFDPFHILGKLSVELNLPAPLPDLSVEITLEWGPVPTPPPLPLPLGEIAIEHFKVTTSWPLSRDNNLLRPNYDSNGDGFLQTLNPAVVTAQEAAAPPAGAPVVPIDGRPHLTFTRPVHDDALVGVNAQPITPAYERIGDPAQNEGPLKVRYSLQEVALHKWSGNTWALAARRGPTPNPSDIPDLYGSWAAMPHMPDGGGENVGQVKLWLWSKTPFDDTRHSGPDWDDWFTDRFRAYPCIPMPKDQEFCYNFEKLSPRQPLTSPWPHAEEPKLIFSWLAPPVQVVTMLKSPVEGLSQALCFPGVISQPDGQKLANTITLDLPQPTKVVNLTIVDKQRVQVTGYDATGKRFGPVFSTPKKPQVVVTGEAMTRVVIQGGVQPCLVAVCFSVGLTQDALAQRQKLAQHLGDALARWSEVGHVLAPHTIYRLKVVTRLQAEGEAALTGYSQDLTQTEFAYFRTEGPHGLAALSIPINHPTPAEFDSGLADLARYVRQTMPLTVPSPGEAPPLPGPVYRAYDVGVTFNEDYVDLMYRLAQRELGLYLYDANNQPMHAGQEQLMAFNNQWGTIQELTLSGGEARWIESLSGNDCGALETNNIPHDLTLTSAATRQVLDPDTIYEARLIPVPLEDPLPAEAPVVYRFKFITSQFTNFYHHLHSFQDESWLVLLPADADVSALVAQAVAPVTPSLEPEIRAYESLVAQQLGQAALLPPPEVQVMRVEQNGQALAFLVRSPEPLDWRRIGLELLRVNRQSLSPDLPGTVKLTEVTFGTTQPNEESVTLLLRDPYDLTGQRLEYYHLPDPLIEALPGGLLYDPFALRVPGRWRFVDEGDQEGPAQWQVSEGELRQMSNIHGGSLIDSDPDKPGTYALAGDTTWTDYRVSVQLRSDGAGAIGVMFRYQDANNYYRFSMDQTGNYRRLIKKHEGVVSVLWEDTFQYISGQVYELTLDCVGHRLVGSLDGLLLFGLEDGDLAAGRIGLYCRANPAACFIQVWVVAPLWTPYYTFGQEERLPAGTRVRVYAGNEANAPSGEAGTMQRFIAPPNESGQLHFSTEGAHLRLSAPDGATGHARFFLPDSAYAPVEAQVLRNADGTGFFVMAPAATPTGFQLEPGSYRLKLTYRRNNQAVDPDSQVLSEAGNSAPEHIIVDIPWQTH